jgi:phosphomannomutase/phosphoglucomutase
MCRGLLDSGANVIDIGTMPTPVFYFAKTYLKADGGVMVTASHNPPKYNGFKLTLGDMPIKPDDIKQIEAIVSSGDFASGSGTLETADVADAYIAFVKGLVGRSNLHVVVDAGNGCTSLLAPKLFRELGCTVTELFCSYDGAFPNRDPNPAVYAHLTALQEAVKSSRAELGVAFDGDGDRVVFVDETGRVVTSEESLCIFIDTYLKDAPSSVVFDLKSSSIVKKQTLKHGGRPVMEKSGHAFIKRTFLDNGSALAGEISGHFFFRELGHDDGIYAALKMAEIISRSGKTYGQLLSAIQKTVITPDIRLHWPYSQRDALLREVEAFGEDAEINTLDGVRIDLPDGWVLVRKSVTEEGVTVRIEADSIAAQKRIISALLYAVPSLRGKHSLFC